MTRLESKPTTASHNGFEGGKEALDSAGSTLVTSEICQFFSEQTEGREVQPWDLTYSSLHFPRSSISALSLVKIRPQRSVCSLPPAASVDKDGVSFTVDVLERWAVFMVLHTGVTVATGAWAVFPQHSFSFCLYIFYLCFLKVYLDISISHVRFKNTFQMDHKTKI